MKLYEYCLFCMLMILAVQLGFYGSIFLVKFLGGI